MHDSEAAPRGSIVEDRTSAEIVSSVPARTP
jgi:hypothetical protein